jgi:hypothetical protein
MGEDVSIVESRSGGVGGGNRGSGGGSGSGRGSGVFCSGGRNLMLAYEPDVI